MDIRKSCEKWTLVIGNLPSYRNLQQGQQLWFSTVDFQRSPNNFILFGSQTCRGTAVILLTFESFWLGGVLIRSNPFRRTTYIYHAFVRNGQRLLFLTFHRHVAPRTTRSCWLLLWPSDCHVLKLWQMWHDICLELPIDCLSPCTGTTKSYDP